MKAKPNFRHMKEAADMTLKVKLRTKQEYMLILPCSDLVLSAD